MANLCHCSPSGSKSILGSVFREAQGKVSSYLRRTKDACLHYHFDHNAQIHFIIINNYTLDGEPKQVPVEMHYYA